MPISDEGLDPKCAALGISCPPLNSERGWLLPGKPGTVPSDPGTGISVVIKVPGHKAEAEAESQRCVREDGAYSRAERLCSRGENSAPTRTLQMDPG